ncbi:MAG TPA: hypothetical protein VK531_12035 [Gemmatimonadales bacterium]|nr:hypothetical protein [Gemmatimonadales bacterium]
MPNLHTAPLPRNAAYPALALWCEELRRGRHGQRADRAATWRLDALWGAACWEWAAQKAARDGMPDTWRHCMQRARDIIGERLAEKAGGA